MTDIKRKSDELKEIYRQFAEDDQKQIKTDYKELLTLPSFRRVLANILKRSRVFGSISFESTNTNEVMKAVGFRELGVDIYMAANQADGELVFKAIAERNEVERERKVKIENAMKGKAT